MAFETANVQPENMGSLKALAGDWTGSAGDASGTLTLGGGRVYMAHFVNQDARSPKELPLVDVSISGSVITLTVHNHMNVTNGRFLIVYA